MNLLKYLVLFLIIGFTGTKAYAQKGNQETAFERELNTRDDQPVREFVESKENIDVKEKAKNLQISGDVRFEWRNIQEKGFVLFKEEKEEKKDNKNGKDNEGEKKEEVKPKKLCTEYRNLRGGDYVDSRRVPISTNDFDVEFNLKIKYTFKNAWAKAHLQFDNPAGIRGRNDCKGEYPVFNEEGDDVIEKIERDRKRVLKGSGDANNINLKRAFMGYNIYADGKHRLDVEIGRQKLEDIFDSEIQFTSRFDGVVFQYASAVEDAFDWYIKAGAFVIDENVNHFGYATEVGFLDIYETGVDIRYNFIDWTKRGENRCHIRNPIGAEYQNSQISVSYTFAQTICEKKIPIELYGGFLVNHAARKKIFTHNRKKNLGWYAGAYIGNADKKGDWSIDIEYIGVQAQAVPEYDVGSIGRGNILDENLFEIVDERPKNDRCNEAYFPRRGNTNFIGWRFEFLYAITDNFSVDVIYEFSNAEDRHIGGSHFYRDFEIEAIYAF